MNEDAVKNALLVPVALAAKMLGVCQRTLKREWERGRFPKPVKVGRRVLIVRAELDAYLKSTMDRRSER